jgi:putative membrane protein
MHTFGMVGMGLIWLVILLIIVALIYIMDSKEETDSAKDILDKRYANGEINEEEYKIIKDSLRL